MHGITRSILMALLATALAGTATAQDEPAPAEPMEGGDEAPGENATEEDVQESVDDYYANPEREAETPAPGVALVLAAAALSAFVAAARRPRG